MRRFLRVRILFVLIALLLVPALALPYAERLRAEWARYWEPRVEASAEPQFASMETLRLLEELEATDYARRAQWGRQPGCGSKNYFVPVRMPVGCNFGAATDESDDAAVTVDLPILEEAAKQERFLRSFEEAEELLQNQEPIGDVLIGYPDARRGAELVAEAEAQKAQTAASAADR